MFIRKKEIDSLKDTCKQLDLEVTELKKLKETIQNICPHTKTKVIMGRSGGFLLGSYSPEIVCSLCGKTICFYPSDEEVRDKEIEEKQDEIKSIERRYKYYHPKEKEKSE